MRLARTVGAILVSLAIAALLARIVDRQERWVRSDTTSTDGRRLVRLTLEADGPIQGWLRTSIPSLAITCGGTDEIEFAVVTRLPAAVEPGNQRSVRYQFDQDEEVITTWTQSSNRQTLTAPVETARQLARRLAGATRFTFAYVPFNAEPALATFSVRGFGRHWSDVGPLCG